MREHPNKYILGQRVAWDADEASRLTAGEGTVDAIYMGTGLTDVEPTHPEASRLCYRLDRGPGDWPNRYVLLAEANVRPVPGNVPTEGSTNG